MAKQKMSLKPMLQKKMVVETSLGDAVLSPDSTVTRALESDPFYRQARKQLRKINYGWLRTGGY